MYRQRASRLPGAFVWSSVSTGDEQRVLPDGCMDLLWDGRAISVAGPDTHAQLVVHDPGAVMTGLRFAPGFAPRVLGRPASEFTDRRVPLDAIWSAARVRQVTDLVAESTSAAGALEEIASRFCTPADEHDALVEEVVTLARTGHNSAAIARAVGLSPRQLQRRSGAAFGYGAKTLNRILRMQRALGLVRGGVRPADSAARSGYADQSHMAREVKDMAGVPLSRLLR